MTKKAKLAALNAASHVRATMIGGMAIEDWPEAKAKLIAEGFVEEKSGNMFCGSRFVMGPKLERIRVGTFKSSGSRYTFSWGDRDSGGDVVSLKAVDTGLELTMFNGAKILYEVI